MLLLCAVLVLVENRKLCREIMGEEGRGQVRGSNPGLFFSGRCG